MALLPHMLLQLAVLPAGVATLAVLPPHACPDCCFSIINNIGCPGAFDCNECPMGLDGYVNAKTHFGAVGNCD